MQAGVGRGYRGGERLGEHGARRGAAQAARRGRSREDARGDAVAGDDERRGRGQAAVRGASPRDQGTGEAAGGDQRQGNRRGRPEQDPGQPREHVHVGEHARDAGHGPRVTRAQAGAHHGVVLCIRRRG